MITGTPNRLDKKLLTSTPPMKVFPTQLLLRIFRDSFSTLKPVAVALVIIAVDLFL